MTTYGRESWARGFPSRGRAVRCARDGGRKEKEDKDEDEEEEEEEGEGFSLLGTVGETAS